GGSFALVQFLLSNFHGPWLVDVGGGLISLVCTALFLRVWRPKETWHFPGEDPAPSVNRDPKGSADGMHPGVNDSFTDAAQSALPSGSRLNELPERARIQYTGRQVFAAWVPWLLLTVFVFLWGIQPVKQRLGAPAQPDRTAFRKGPDQMWIEPGLIRFKVPGLHERIARDYPVVSQREAEPADYEFNWLSATGTGIFLAAILSGLWLGFTPRRFIEVFLSTCYKMRWPLVTIACMLAIAFTTRYSGMDATLGLAFTHTGWLYPLFAALLGWLGVALTGSDTSSNALFGPLQTITAGQLATSETGAGVLPLSDQQAKILLAAANSTGGVMGKMIDAQSIVVAAVATGQHNQEGPILRFVFWHSLILAVLIGLLVLFQAYVWTSSIP
ncbi:MAG: L-lactate permease, partial [Gemmataceae bacterium]|nr:L-lactate permease [Gemmataceae bacterium]